MNPIERATRLKNEADELLQEIKLAERCRHIGRLTPTGSYYLDLMMYPDIDLYLPPATPRKMFQIVTGLVEEHPVMRVNFLKGGSGPLEDGLYIKPVIAVGEWERPWKIDIWAISQSFIEEKTDEMNSYKMRMTPEQRELILNYKYSVLNEDGRTPYFSGIFIYQAVIDQGLWENSEITNYLRKNSIDI
jgi:hypothetical protein